MQKDYIMRVIEQFIQALISIIQRRKEGKYDEAFEQIQKVSLNYLKADIKLLLLYAPHQLVDQFRDSTGYLDAQLCIFCADLFHEVAFMKEKEERLRLNLTALFLYKTALAENKRFQTKENLDKISELEKNAL